MIQPLSRNHLIDLESGPSSTCPADHPNYKFWLAVGVFPELITCSRRAVMNGAEKRVTSKCSSDFRVAIKFAPSSHRFHKRPRRNARINRTGNQQTNRPITPKSFFSSSLLADRPIAGSTAHLCHFHCRYFCDDSQTFE